MNPMRDTYWIVAGVVLAIGVIISAVGAWMGW